MAINRERREEFGLTHQPKDTKDKRGEGGKEGNSETRKTDASSKGKQGWGLGGDDQGTMGGPGTARSADSSGKGTKGWAL